LGSRRENWPYESALWVRRCKRFIELEDRLPAILKGQERPSSAAERLDLAELCHYKGLHVSAVRLFTEAFNADAKLAEDFQANHRYRAACSAAQAGCGQGEEAAGLDEEERARLRGKALAWLQADLAWVARQMKGGSLEDRSRLGAALLPWQIQPALARVRDAKPLAELPSAERAAWQKLWDEVAATLAKARDAE
jgi:hypothetical protein